MNNGVEEENNEQRNKPETVRKKVTKGKECEKRIVFTEKFKIDETFEFQFVVSDVCVCVFVFWVFV